MEPVTKQKVIWLHDKGKNTIPREEMLGDLLNAVAGWNNPNVKPQLMTVKDFSSPTMTIVEKLAALTPSLEPLPCPLARLLGIPLTLYAYPEAKAGQPPNKGDLNMIAMLLTRRTEDGVSRPIRGKALVCLEDSTAAPGRLDLPPDLLVKLLFFAGDLVRDTIGHLAGAELDAALSNAKVFFQFYGPGRHVRDQMTNLCLMDAKAGPGAPPAQIIPVAQLKQQLAAQDMQKMAQQRSQNLPQFMHQPFMQNMEYLAELKAVVERGWTAPSGSTADDANERKENELGQDNNDDGADEGLDFSDFGKKTN